MDDLVVQQEVDVARLSGIGACLEGRRYCPATACEHEARNKGGEHQ